MSNRLYILDGLRFLLALQVLFFHYGGVFSEVGFLTWNICTNGRLAVLGFFILSGFLMHETALNATPVEFVVKRIVRLYPAFIICAFLTFLVCNKVGLNLTISNYIANLTFFPKLLFNEKILDGVYWTLQHEIVFYFHVFLLLLTNKFRYLLFPNMCLLLLLCLIWSIGFGYESYPGKYKLLLLIPYGPLFIIGVLLSYLRHNLSCKVKFAILIAVLLSIHNERVHYFQSIQDIMAIDPIISTFMINLSIIVPIIIILLSTSSYFNLIKLNKLKNIFIFLGGISYPIYLLHSRIAIELVNVGIVGRNLSGMLTMIFAIFAVATIVYKIELKIRIFIKQKLYNKFYPKLSTSSAF